MTDSTQRPRILVVDDDDDSTELYRYLFDQRGLDVMVAGSMRTALESFRASRVDLVMTDLNLPDGSGYDLLAAMKRIADVPAIAVTGMSGREVEQRCRSAGFAAHFLKPIDIDQVADTAHALVGARATRTDT